MLAERRHRARLRAFVTHFLGKRYARADVQTRIRVTDNAVAVKIDFLAVAGREEPKFAGGVEPRHRSDRWPVVAFYLPLGAANAILKLPASALERIVDRKSQIGTPFVRRSRPLHVHFAAFRERKMNVNLIKSADVVMMAGPFQHHPASRNAVPALLEFGDMFIDGVPDLLCRIYVLKFDFGWRLHV